MYLILCIGLAQQREHKAVAGRCCLVMALDDAGLRLHADPAQQSRADGGMMAVRCV